MKVKMLVQTNFAGLTRREGEIHDVSEEVAKRWVNNKIALARKEDLKKLTEEFSVKEEEDEQDICNPCESSRIPNDSGSQPSSGSSKASKKK